MNPYQRAPECEADMLADGYVSCPWCGRQGTVRTNESPYGDNPEERCPLCEGSTWVSEGVAQVVNALLARNRELMTTIAALRRNGGRIGEIEM